MVNILPGYILVSSFNLYKYYYILHTNLKDCQVYEDRYNLTMKTNLFTAQESDPKIQLNEPTKQVLSAQIKLVQPKFDTMFIYG